MHQQAHTQQLLEVVQKCPCKQSWCKEQEQQQGQE
jgi:hypothetical protein